MSICYGGTTLRDPLSPYKVGRSTLKEQYLLKLKRFTDGEAHITGYTEAVSEDMRTPLGILGALEVQDLKTKASFKVGTGYTDRVRQDLWHRRVAIRGRIIKYKHQAFGAKDAARIPVFLGFRDMEGGDI